MAGVSTILLAMVIMAFPAMAFFMARFFQLTRKFG
jgi:hypothetical protein